MPTTNTRFRAYQLGNAGSSASYFDGVHFTLIEARLTAQSWKNLCCELHYCKGAYNIDYLHITSWDEDHCAENELRTILAEFKPTIIEIPAYAPHTECSQKCKNLILNYAKLNASVQVIEPHATYISALPVATEKSCQHIFYNKGFNHEKSNDNSTVKLFRTGSFNVASFGDLESASLADIFINDPIMKAEVDVLILPHHGADNGFTSDKFLKALKPRVAICTSDYDNAYEHPKPEIRALLSQNEIPLFTTKTGDIIIESKTKMLPSFF